MVRVNNQNFELYKLDTIETILIRIASKMKTIPKYLILDKNITIDDFYKK